MKLDRIGDIIAADEWSYSLSDGTIASARIEIGRPQLIRNDPNGDWFCAIFIEGFTPKITPIYGVGAVDALSNAMALVGAFSDRIGDYTPGSSRERRNE